MGFTKHLVGDLDTAIDLYHQALSCKPDDPFCSEMLNKALQEALSTSFTIGEDENNRPPEVKEHLQNRSTDADTSRRLKRLNANTSMSMISDEGLNLSVESDIDMSMT